MKRIVFLLVCAFGLVCSCDDRNDALFDGLSPAGGPVAEDSVAVAFSFGREGYIPVAGEETSSSRAGGTRATDNKWTQNDEIGIYMLKKSGASFDYDLSKAWRKNRKYKIGSSGRFEPEGDADKLYYPAGGEPVRFVAYYPYASGATSANALTFDFAGQSTKPLKEAKDFLFHRGETDYSKSNSDIVLSFSHKFSKILMTVLKGDGGPSLSALTVELAKMPKTAKVDLDRLARQQADGIAVDNTAANVTAIAPYVYDGSDTQATVEVIVAPHTGGGNFAGRTFTFTAGGKTFTYALDNSVAFEPGKVYTFTFTLKSSGVAQTSDGMTNCYMVKPGNTLKFPVSRAYTYNGANFTTTLHTGGAHTGAFTANVIWDDNSVINGTPGVSGSGNTAEVSVNTNSGKTGNAVVGIYKSGDNTTPVWSYHIWVTGYDPDNGGATWTNPKQTKATYTFMDRNLGATEAVNNLAGRGLFYQWGRKDPFPGGEAGTAGYAALDKFFGMTDAGSTSTVTVSSDDNAAAIVESIQKPTTFFIVKNRTYLNWLPALDNKLWNTSENKKTIYDPCPAGWRVPIYVNNSTSNANSPWAGVSDQSFSSGDTGGVNWGSDALYPAAGYRYGASGAIINSGSNGSCWSASPSSDVSYHASHLYFYSGSVYVSNSYSRTFGLSVRCSQE
jgi:hypothetical protein